MEQFKSKVISEVAEELAAAVVAGPATKFVIDAIQNCGEPLAKEALKAVKNDEIKQKAIASAAVLNAFYARCNQKLKAAAEKKDTTRWHLTASGKTQEIRTFFGAQVVQNWTFSCDLKIQDDTESPGGIYSGVMSVDISHDMTKFAEDILMSNWCVIPIYYYNDLYMQKSYVSGVYSNPFATKFFQYATLSNGSKTLRINLASEPDYLDPALNSSVDGACLAAASFAGLYTYNSAGVTAPALAEGYTVSADGLTYTVTLKKNLKWSDGSALTANDFVYSWKRAVSPEGCGFQKETASARNRLCRKRIKIQG